MSEVEGENDPRAREKPVMQPKIPFRWDDMSKPERKLYVQAEQEFATNMVSQKILEQAKRNNRDEEKLEQRYVALRYRQLWRHSVAQQEKIARQHLRQKRSEAALGVVSRPPANEEPRRLGTALRVLISASALAALGWAAYALFAFLSKTS